MSQPSHSPKRVEATADARRRALLTPFGTAPFTTGQALRAGLTEDDLRSHVVTRVMRGVYVAGSARVDDHALRCAAGLTLVGRDAQVAAVDAARLLKLPTTPGDRPYISLPGPLRGRHFRDLHLVSRTPATRRTAVWMPRINQSIPVTHPEDVVAECALTLSLVEGVMLADAVLEHASDPVLVQEQWHATRGPAGARVRQIVRWARPGAESAMETRTRLLVVFGGFPEPVLQHVVRVGGRSFRLDMAYPELRLGIEYDGSHHYATEAQKHADIRRAEALQSEGWHCMHVVAHGIFQDPLGTLNSLEEMFMARGGTVRRSSAWRRHFKQHGEPGVW